MAAWRYEILFSSSKTGCCVFRHHGLRFRRHRPTVDALIREMMKCFSTLEEEFRLSKLPCKILYFPGSSVLLFVMFKIQNTTIPVPFIFKKHSIHLIIRVF